jgi:uncharacterized protein (DUF488 family)
MPEIFTVGHSNKSIHDFLALLRGHEIQAIADVRRFPMSRRHPHFGMDALRDSLRLGGIAYEHFSALGGRRDPRPDSNNTNWKNPSFRGYADYMESPEFHKVIEHLRQLAESRRTALMCAEALWWQCHRSLIADYLKAAGWTVTHIVGATKLQEHPYTTAARMVEGRLSYAAESLFDASIRSASKR